ncbi:MAG: L-threonylcarbamoyladenylate synthase [bacterium]
MILSVEQAVQILSSSGIVAVPTETVYGLAGVATDSLAIDKIFKAKNRPRDNPLICHFGSIGQIKEYVQDFPRYFEKLVQKFSPGPISYLLSLPSNSTLLPATGGLTKVIVRIPDHTVFKQIVTLLGKPLAAPSANTSTKFSATTSQMVEADLGDKIDGVVEGGSSNVGLESTIIDCTAENFVQILRPGAIGQNELEAFFLENNFNVRVAQKASSENIPGNKYRHYSPKTKILNFTSLKNVPKNQKIAILGLEQDLIRLKMDMSDNSNIVLINLGQNLNELAHNFYAQLFYLDSLNLDTGYLLTIPEENSSVWLAINNKIDKIIIDDK